MQRYFIEKKQWNKEKVFIEGPDVHHITRVMRMTTGDPLIGIHPELGPACCLIAGVAEETVECNVVEWLEENREMPVHVTVVSGLGKGDKLEHVVQKGTELGAYDFIPYQADRSVAKWDPKKVAKKVQRLQKISKEASEQSERSHVPEIHPLYTLNELTDLKEQYHWCFFAYADEARKESPPPLAEQLRNVRHGEKILVVFGPEGGFSEKEVQVLEEQGFLSVRLGPRILRMETAPLYFLTAISYHFEESSPE